MGTVPCIERRLTEIRISLGTTSSSRALTPRPRTRTKNGLTLLHWATKSRSGRVALAWILVEHGADVTVKDDLGWTPSHASTFGHEELARFLVEHEVDSTAQPRTGLLRSIWNCLEILWNSYAPSSWRM